MTSKPDKVTTKLQINYLVIREGAYYLFDNGSVAGPANKTKHMAPNTWNIGGNFYTDNGQQAPGSWPDRPKIVCEVTITPVAPPEPKRKVVWINFDADSAVTLCSSKSAAEGLKHNDRIACQKFELIEGAFDEE